MRIRNQKDFWAGVMFVAFGIFFAGFGTKYRFGTAAEMGPGYFPTVLGIIMLLLGLIISVGALSPRATEDKVNRFDWPIVLFIIGPILLFGLLLQPLGLVASLFVLVMVSSYASHEFHWREALINSVVLIVLSLGIFAWALKLQFELWPSFIAG
jgi:hypothetical protein